MILVHALTQWSKVGAVEGLEQWYDAQSSGV